MDILKRITEEFKLKDDHAKNIVALLDKGNTIRLLLVTEKK